LIIFSIIFDIVSTVEIRNLKDIKIEKISCEVLDEEVDDIFQTFCKNYKEPFPVEKVIDEEILVKVNVKSKINGKKIPSLDLDDFLLRSIKEESTSNDYFLAVRKAVCGEKAGNVVNIDHKLSKDFDDKNLAGKKININIKILEVCEYIPAEFNDKAAVSNGFESVEGTRNFIRLFMENSQKYMVSLYHKRIVLDALAEAYNFKVSPFVVESDFSIIWEQAKSEILHSKENGDEEFVNKSMEEIEKEYRDVANRRVRLGFIVEAIAKKYNCSITENTVEKKIQEEINSVQSEKEKRDLVKFYRNNTEAREYIGAQLLEDFAINKVLEEADVTEKVVSRKELAILLKDIIP
jgi:trigger factor